MIRFAGKDARSGNTGAMMLHEQITHSLAGLKGLDSDLPTAVEWSSENGTTVAVDFRVVDSLSCGFRELRVSAERLINVPFDALQSWADNLCKQVTYLLEQIGPVERDAAAQTVLIRSTPPTKEPERTAYYEMLVQAPGAVSLRRYAHTTLSPDRIACNIEVTHEVLDKLVHDIIAAIPSAT